MIQCYGVRRPKTSKGSAHIGLMQVLGLKGRTEVLKNKMLAFCLNTSFGSISAQPFIQDSTSIN